MIDNKFGHFIELIDILFNQMINIDTTGFIYSEFIEKKLSEIKERGIDIKPFLNS